MEMGPVMQPSSTISTGTPGEEQTAYRLRQILQAILSPQIVFLSLFLINKVLKIINVFTLKRYLIII